jgi:hypothetical protein
VEKQYFRLNNTDFGFDKAQLILQEQEQLLTLEITGNKRITELLAADSTQEFKWVLYPPKLYLRNVPYLRVDGNITVRITDELLDAYDIALYLMEHNDILGVCTITTSEIIHFNGTTYLDGEEMVLSIAGKVEA